MDLFLGTHCPETIFQIVLRRSAEGVDIAEGTVVVGYHQTFIRDDTARTSEIQGYYGIGHSGSRSFCIIDFPSIKKKSPFLHFLLQSGINGVNHPHPFVCTHLNRVQNNQQKYRYFFHCSNTKIILCQLANGRQVPGVLNESFAGVSLTSSGLYVMVQVSIVISSHTLSAVIGDANLT